MKELRVIIIWILVIISLLGLSYLLLETKEAFNECKIIAPINPDDLNCGTGYFVNRFKDQALTCCKPPPPPPPPLYTNTNMPHIHPGTF